MPPKYFWVILENLDFRKVPPELLERVAGLGWELVKANLSLKKAEQLFDLVRTLAVKAMEEGYRQAKEAVARRPEWMQ